MNNIDSCSLAPLQEVLLSRKQLAERWSCCTATLKRREAAGQLVPVRFNARMVRYRLSDIVAFENAQGGRPV